MICQLMNEDLQSFEVDNRIFSFSTIPGFSDWYKENESYKVWWVEEIGTVGRHLFSFDKKKLKYLIKKIRIGQNFLVIENEN